MTPMKTLLFLCGMTIIGRAAFAQNQGLHLKWGACPNNPAATAVEDFACDGSVNPHLLHGTFSLNTSVTSVRFMDAIIDLLFAQPDVPPFWQFQAQGCNETGLGVIDARPAAPACAVAPANTNSLCGAGGVSFSPLLFVFDAAQGFPANRVRLMISFGRGEQSLTMLAPNTGTNAHFAFVLQFFEDSALELGGACDGCLTGVSITWNQAMFSSGESIVATLSSSDP